MSRGEKKIMLIDGFCNLCNGIVAFTVKRDPGGIIQFAALQSSEGQKLLMQYCLPASDFKTFVLIENDKAYTKSTAALKYFKTLNPPWPLLYIFILVPEPVRNFVYDIVSMNRYRWFGKRQQCLTPSNELKNRFL